ncbi:MAG: ThuA domain-containing protein [Acidimicrobiales bacterium]
MDNVLMYVTEVAPYERDVASGAVRLAGVHRVLPQSATALAEMADVAGLGFVHTNDVRSLPADALDNCRVLALYTIGETPWSEPQRRKILERVRAGETHVLAIHSATDSCHGWDDFGRLIGARFECHPWTQQLTIEVVDADHPATRGLPVPWHLEDEIYLFENLRPDARILLRLQPDGLDMSRPGAHVPEIGFPLAWSLSEGAGRVFYTSLGHFPSAYENVSYLHHLYGGLSWLLGREVGEG